MTEGLNAFLDFVYPPKCLLCSAVGAWLCEDCRDAFPLPETPLCQVCGDPLPTNAFCRRCGEALKPIRAAAFAAVYDGSARDCVRKLKYDSKRRLARPMAEAMAFQLHTRGSMQGTDVIVPVALHHRRMRQRGYNQSVWLARELSCMCGLPVIDVLERVRDTHSQVGLRAEERAKNMQGAFRAGTGIAGSHILLLDDVSTTGATARDAARALLDAGAADVRLLTFARDL